MSDELISLGGGAHALATQILGNSEDARDAVQDVFATVLGRPGAYDSAKGSLRTWFLRLVRNRCIDMLRMRRAGGAPAEESLVTTEGPEAAAEVAQRNAALTAALQSLDADQRQIIVLRDYLDLSYAEISGVLEVPAGTVMSRLHRARIALGKAYRQRYDDKSTN
ncbi:MAG: sigma-70 family RNA polymerase sigma factor [Gammaproteobacteria bacterium]|jgi:RNA polymerase sigma-70 factor (ECF subfamily)